MDRAEGVLRAFAERTNLQLAGRGLVIEADAVQSDAVQSSAVQSTAAALREMARGMGMHVLSGTADAGPGTFTVRLGADPHRDVMLLDGAPLPERTTAAQRVDFAHAHMTTLAAVATHVRGAGTLAGARIGVCLPLEPKTAVLALTLRDLGAHVSLYAHPDERDQAVAEDLARRGVPVEGPHGASADGGRAAALEFLDRDRDLLVDDGAHLIRLAHEDLPARAGAWWGASEETTSGIPGLQHLALTQNLHSAVVVANDAATKRDFDNRFGTGQSCVMAVASLLAARGVTVRDQHALVVGFGPVGQGVAEHLRALGAEVTVAETDPTRALYAAYCGYRVGAAAEAAAGALVVSATGRPGTLSGEVRNRAAYVAVAGGAPGELDLTGVTVTDGPYALLPNGGVVLGPQGAVNLVAAEGNPIEIMDLSFATQLAALAWLAGERPPAGLYELGEDHVQLVARAALATRGLATAGPPATAMAPSHGWRFGTEAAS